MCNVQGDPKNVNILWYFLPTGFVDLAMRPDCLWSNQVTLQLADFHAGYVPSLLQSQSNCLGNTAQ